MHTTIKNFETINYVEYHRALRICVVKNSNWDTTDWSREYPFSKLYPLDERKIVSWQQGW